MKTQAIRALVRNDLRLFFTDRRAVVIGVLVPILIAAFFGYVFGGAGRNDDDAGKVPVAVVDEDQSKVTQAIIKDLSGDAMLDVVTLTRAEASEQVRKGTRQTAAIFPQGFGEKSVSALFSGQDKPKVELLVDPSQTMSARLVQGLLAQYSMQNISAEAFNGVTGRVATDGFLQQLETEEPTPRRDELKTLLQSVQRFNNLQSATPAGGEAAGSGAGGFGLGIPYDVSATEMVANDTPYNGYAHSFAGMSIQFILFAGIDAGVVLLLLRQRGIWQRLRSAPLSKAEFMLSRALATALISAFQLVVIYTVAIAFFGVRIQGSVPGFLAVAVAFCLLNAAFGLMLATLGRSAAATRGIATMAMLLLLMLGGAWVPAFVFPRWLQQASMFTPTRWAVDGLDAMTWRGLPFGDAVLPAVVLVGTAVLCFAIAVWRFRWEE